MERALDLADPLVNQKGPKEQKRSRCERLDRLRRSASSDHGGGDHFVAELRQDDVRSGEEEGVVHSATVVQLLAKRHLPR